MTETPPPDFATPGDVVGRWRALTPAENTKAELRIGDASAIIRSVIDDIDARVAADPNVARAAMTTVVDAVVRVLQNPNGAKRVQETIGDKAYTLDFDGAPSGLFITAEEMAPLLPSAGGGVGVRIGSAIGQARAGWAPVPPGWRSPHSADWWPNDG